MLRIAGSKPIDAKPAEDDLLDDGSDEEHDGDEVESSVGAVKPKMTSEGDTNKVLPERAGYLGPENGPFECGNCYHFTDGACDIVAGQIDAKGCCNLFTPVEEAADSMPEATDVEPTDAAPPGEEV